MGISVLLFQKTVIMHIFQEHYIVFNWIVDCDLEKNRSRSKFAIEAMQVEYNVKVVNRKELTQL